MVWWSCPAYLVSSCFAAAYQDRKGEGQAWHCTDRLCPASTFAPCQSCCHLTPFSVSVCSSDAAGRTSGEWLLGTGSSPRDGQKRQGSRRMIQWKGQQFVGLFVSQRQEERRPGQSCRKTRRWKRQSQRDFCYLSPAVSQGQGGA